MAPITRISATMSQMLGRSACPRAGTLISKCAMGPSCLAPAVQPAPEDRDRPTIGVISRICDELIVGGERDVLGRGNTTLAVPWSCSRNIGIDPCCQNLIDPASIDIDDLDPPAVEFKPITDLRQRAEMLQHQARDSMVTAVSGHRNGQQFRELVDRHPPGNEVGPVNPPYIGWLGRTLFGTEGA